jgi:zinc transporter ZupT
MLAAVALTGAVLGWYTVPVLERVDGVVPSVPWTAVVVLALLAALLFVAAYTTHRTIHRRREVMDPRRAVNLLVLAKASAIVGALVAAAYLGFGAHWLDDLDIALPRERVIRSSLAAVAGVLVCVGGLLLERACRVPRVPDDLDDDASEPPPPYHLA